MTTSPPPPASGQHPLAVRLPAPSVWVGGVLDGAELLMPSKWRW